MAVHLVAYCFLLFYSTPVKKLARQVDDDDDSSGESDDLVIDFAYAKSYIFLCSIFLFPLHRHLLLSLSKPESPSPASNLIGAGPIGMVYLTSDFKVPLASLIVTLCDCSVYVDLTAAL